MKVSVLESFARHGARLAVLLVFLIGVTGVCHAQAVGATAQPAAKAAVPATMGASAAPAAQAAQPAAPPERRPGGNHEGITVRGQWTIEVRNPDGKLVTHREFENGLTPYAGEGATLLSAFIGRVVTPGLWMVELADPILTNYIQIGEAGTCTPGTITSGTNTRTCSATPLSLMAPTLSSSSPYLGGPSTLTLQGSAIVPSSFPRSVSEIDSLCG